MYKEFLTFYDNVITRYIVLFVDSNFSLKKNKA